MIKVGVVVPKLNKDGTPDKRSLRDQSGSKNPNWKGARAYSEKVCSKCHLTKSIDNFNKSGRGYYHTYCRSCLRDFEKEKLLEDPNYLNNRKLSHRYGISVEERDEMLEEQEGRCKICMVVLDSKTKATTPHIDHCHKTNKIRGILCDHCNKGLGHFRDDIFVLECAADYLRWFI